MTFVATRLVATLPLEQTQQCEARGTTSPTSNQPTLVLKIKRLGALGENIS